MKQQRRYSSACARLWSLGAHIVYALGRGLAPDVPTVHCRLVRADRRREIAIGEASIEPDQTTRRSMTREP